MSTELIEGLSPPQMEAPSAEGLVNEVPEFENRIPQEEKPFVLSPYGEKLIALIGRYIPVYERETGVINLPWDQLTPQTKALVASGFSMGLAFVHGTLQSVMANPDNVEFKRVTPEGGDYASGDSGDPGGGDGGG